MKKKKTQKLQLLFLICNRGKCAEGEEKKSKDKKYRQTHWSICTDFNTNI